MKIGISDNLIRHYLENVYFINGHSYAGKSTMVKLLAERFDMICCGENYHDVFPREKLSRWKQPGLCYFDTMRGWQEWLGMTPEEHRLWIEEVTRECVEIEILELIRRRPATLPDLALALELPETVTEKILDELFAAGRVGIQRQQRGTFYLPSPEECDRE